MDKKYTIQDLVDIERLHSLFESFSKATGFTTGFLSYPGQELLIATGWRDICRKFHRACPASAACCKESNIHLTACLKELKELNIKPCGNGLVDGATPVIIRGVHLATVSTGQVLLAPPDIDFFKGLAAKYGYNEDEYLAALAKVPVVSEEQLKSALAFLSGLAVQIAEEGLSRLQLQEAGDELRKAKEAVDRQVAKRTSELQIANTTLRESQENLRLLVEQAPVSVAMLDRNMYFLATSRRWIAKYGRGHDNLVGLHHYAIHPDIPDYRREVHRKGLAGEAQECEEDKWVMADGTVSWSRWAVHPWRDIQGVIGGIIISTEDITERKRAEEALRKSEALLRAVWETTPDPIFLKDVESRMLMANPATLSAFGKPLEEVLGKRDDELYTDIERARTILENDRRIIETGVATAIEEVIPTPDGARIFLSTKAPYRDDDGCIVGTIGVARDITERKQMEEEIRAARDHLEQRVRERTAELLVANVAIRKSEASLRALSDNIPNGITYQLVRTPEGHSWFEYISEGVDRLYGFPAARALADARTIYAAIHPEDAHRILQEGEISARALRICDVEGRIITPVGDVRWMHWRSTPVRLENGNTISYGIATDITGRKKTEEALNRAHRTLHVLKECDAALVRANSESELLGRVCRILMNIWGAQMAWVGFAEDNLKKTVRVAAHSGSDDGYVEKLNLTWADEPRGRGPAGTAIRTREVNICRDIPNDPCFAPWREEALKRGYASTITLPLVTDNRCLGALMLYSTQIDAFNNEEAEMLKQLAGDLTYGIVSLRTRAECIQLQRALLEISEHEKQLISQELHDGLCQNLAGTVFLTSILHSRLVAKKEHEAELAKKICDLLNVSTDEARHLAHGLHPVGPEGDGLRA